MRYLALCGILLFAPVAASAAEPAMTTITWNNPLVEQRADAQIAYQADGNYYFTATVPEYDRIELRRAPSLEGLRTAEPKVIWHKHDTGIMASHIWAPELHHINGKWYVYFAAGGQPNVWDIRLYVLENSSPDPFQGEWVEKGEIKTKWESFALDATTFEWKGVRYLVWAQKDPAFPRVNSNLYIAKMDTPWSITGEQVMISKPDLPWEQIGYQVNEGPAVLIRHGRVFLTYSASATDFNYCLGMLTAKDDADLLDPQSWTKSPRPVFATWTVNGVYGPGHNSFTTTPDGKTDILVYHARTYRDIKGDPLNDPNRGERAQVILYHPDGTPDFGVPVADGPVTIQTYATAPVSMPSATTTATNSNTGGQTVVYVPVRVVAPEVSVFGLVYHPGTVAIPANGTLTLASAIKQCGGLNPNADRYIDIRRLDSAGGTIELKDVDLSGALTDPKKDIVLQAGDKIFVTPSVNSSSFKRP